MQIHGTYAVYAEIAHVYTAAVYKNIENNVNCCHI